MAYITTTDLSGRLGATLYARLTDRTAGTTANSTVAQQIVDQAEAEANGYLSRRFATPISLTAHPELADVFRLRVLDLAESIAWRGSPFVSDVPSRVKTLHDEARQWFEDVARGAAEMPASGPLPGTAAAEDAPRYRSTPRAFTADELDGL